MKDEIDLSGNNDFLDVKAVIDDLINYYNNDRYQWVACQIVIKRVLHIYHDR